MRPAGRGCPQAGKLGRFEGCLVLLRTICLAVLVAAARLGAAEQSQLDASLTMFSVLAALNASGFDAELQSTSNHPLRQAVRKAVAGRKLSLAAELRRYVRDHRQENDTRTLSLYISFALCVDAPTFKYRVRTSDLPPEVAALEGLPELMKRFHQEADIDTLWKQAQPAIDQLIATYHEPVSRVVLEVNGYLRNPTSGYLGRRFQVYLDPLGPPNQIHVRSYGDEFFVVVTNSVEPMIDDIRHAYLQYLVSPMVLKHHEILEKKKGLGDFAQASPLLPDIYKQDFPLLTEKSLVKAIEARLATGPGLALRRQQMVEQALAEGFILTPYFSEALVQYEKQEQSMRFYFTDLLAGIDLKKEDKRLETVKFASSAVVRRAKTAPAPPPVEPGKMEKALTEAEDLLEARQLAEARSRFLKVLEDTDDKRVHARAYYGLARIAIRSNQAELGEKLFTKTLELGPEPAVKAWCLVVLGQLADAAGNDVESAAHYKAAMAVEGISEKARENAAKGLKGEFRRKSQ